MFLVEERILNSHYSYKHAIEPTGE